MAGPLTPSSHQTATDHTLTITLSFLLSCSFGGSRLLLDLELCLSVLLLNVTVAIVTAPNLHPVACFPLCWSPLGIRRWFVYAVMLRPVIAHIMYDTFADGELINPVPLGRSGTRYFLSQFTYIYRHPKPVKADCVMNTFCRGPALRLHLSCTGSVQLPALKKKKRRRERENKQEKLCCAL